MPFHLLPAQGEVGSLHRGKNTDPSLMPLLTICHITTELCVPVWCHMGMCQTEPKNLQPIPCLVLSNTVSRECDAQATGGKHDLGGCHMWISSLEAHDSLGNLLLGSTHPHA